MTTSGNNKAPAESGVTAPPPPPRGPGRGRRNRDDLTTGNVRRQLWKLAWPQWTEGMLQVIDQLSDVFWAGRLPDGFRAIAGVGIAQTLTQIGSTARVGIDQAQRAMVARAVGAGDIALANHIVLQGFTLSFAFAWTIAVIGWFLTDPILAVMRMSPEIQAQTSLYMKITFIGTALVAMRQMSGSALTASGEVQIPLRGTMATRFSGIILSPILMFGWLGMPEMGLTGAAVANLFAQSAGIGVNMYGLFSGASRLHLSFKGYHLDFAVWWRMLKIGIPASFTGMERNLSQIILLALVTPFGDASLSSYALARRVENFANFGTQGIGSASGIMVGQNLGAGRADRARMAIRWGMVYVVAVQVLIGAAMLLFPTAIVRIFTQNPDVVELTSHWLRILAFGLLFLGMAQVFQQSFNQAGDTISVTLVTFASLTLIELPLAWVLSSGFGLGPLGIAYAHVAGMALRTLFFLPVFFWGRWTRVKVF